MKKTIKLSIIVGLALGTTSAFATNGSVMIGTGAKALSMGGTGIGMSHGAESALVNPALITSVENNEISFGGTFFMPDVSNNTGDGYHKSDADLSVVPMVATTTKVNDNLFIGVGMWGTAGMGVDYRDFASQYKMVTNLQLMQFGIPIAYKVDNFSFAVTPLLQYGALDINFVDGRGTHGNGVAQDLKFGYNVGVAYKVSKFTIGAVYKSKIDMDYKNQIPDAGRAFGLNLGSKLSTPAEIGLGLSYAFGGSTFALDYKKIKYSNAKGYKDFGWKDQDVISLGYQYSTELWSTRIGYNYAKSPIVNQNGTTQKGAAINTLNLLGFPAIVKSHYTIGGTYKISKKTSFDFAYVYSPEAKNSFDNSGVRGRGISTKHSQSALSIAVNFNF